MNPKEQKQKLSTSETASPSLSKNTDLVITSPSLSNVDVGEAMKKQNDVAMFLAEKVISVVAKNSNFVFSPASINAILTMVAATSSEEALRSFILSFLKSSSTDELNAVFREIASLVLVDGSESGGPKIAAVNGAWMEQSLPVDPSMKDLFENFFKAAFAQVDFRFKGEQARMEANSWASKNTNGLINNLLPPGSVSSDTECIYGNALYFKGAWQNKFYKSLTRDKEFHLLDGTSVSVPFMHSSDKQYITDYDGFKVLGLPFRQCGDTNRRFSMYFYLPDKKDGLNDLVKRMASTPGFLESHIPEYKREVGEFRIPKFKIEFGFDVSSALDKPELLELVSVSLYHKAWVEIDEDGAKAMDITRFVLSRTSFGCGRKMDFVADHPFLFMIREDETGTVLFVGQIFDPTKSSSV
ncbi:unnamed protein product [Arabidopsis arenosa]|uniref:Serpin domain-containing protein n=1 Tax=Arabidopsis arenosa TaxID=38785 RepID=A0A8S1ZSM4_ARAAE|nr:unnamed protein product [Arabidopsis arenosa]